MGVLVRFEDALPGPWPGCAWVGAVKLSPGSGGWLPLYDAGPPEGGPSINTAFGWNALVERMEKK